MERFARAGVTLAYPLAGWAICGTVMGIGRAVTSLETTLVVHAVAVPIVFGALSWSYFVRFRSATPLRTAVVFTTFVITLDAVLVAPVFERSYAMFGSLSGTWVPFGLIFASTYVVGVAVRRPLAPSARPSKQRGAGDPAFGARGMMRRNHWRR